MILRILPCCFRDTALLPHYFRDTLQWRTKTSFCRTLDGFRDTLVSQCFLSSRKTTLLPQEPSHGPWTHPEHSSGFSLAHLPRCHTGPYGLPLPVECPRPAQVLALLPVPAPCRSGLLGVVSGPIDGVIL
jgi:hypothetical protein